MRAPYGPLVPPGAAAAAAARAWAATTIPPAYQALFQGSPHPMLVFDEDTLGFLAVNAAACRLYGWSEDEFLALTIESIRPASELPRLHAALDAARGTRAMPRIAVWRHRTRDGEPLDMEVTSYPLPTPGRHARLVLAYDVTERLRGERLLREREATLRAFYESTAHVMGVAEVDDADTDILVVHDNPASEAYFHLPSGPAAGRWASEMGLSDEVKRLWIGHYRAAQRSGQPSRFEARLPGANGGELWLSAAVAFIGIGPSGRARFSYVAEEITARKQAEQRAAESERALRQADARKDEFLAVLAHELRNPLAPVRTAVEILGCTPMPDARSTEARAVIGRQVQHMARLIDDLLDVARITHGKLEIQRAPVQLQSVLQMAVEAAQPHLRAAGQELSLELVPRPLWVEGDALRLSQVVLNLLNNASKYTAPQGRIVLRLVEGADGAVVSVTDTGIGIDAQAQARLFEMFSRVHDPAATAAGGLGVGLALARAIVQRHGGRIAARSPGLGRGSTFEVVLPLVAAPAQAVPARPPAAVEPSAAAADGDVGPLRILVADDNVDAAQTLESLLELMGHESRAAIGGHAAVAQALDWQPDLLLLDLGMPDIDGFGVCRAIRAAPLARQPVVVALTGWGQAQDRRRTAEAGFDGHLVKPMQAAALEPFFLLAAQRRDAAGAPARSAAQPA